MELKVYIISILLKLQVFHCLPCGDPGPIHNGTITGDPSFNVGEIVRFECNKCFELTGPSVIQCSRWGHWSGKVPKCTPVKCPSLNIGKNEVLEGKEFGFEYHFQCDPPSVLIGRNVVRCMCHGRWSSKPPVCKILSTTKPPKTTQALGEGYCPFPKKLINGDTYDVKFGNSKFYQPGDRIYFLCDERHRLIGPYYRECQTNHLWDGDLPYCQRKSDDDFEPDNIAPEFNIVQYCSKFFPPINGEVMGSNQLGMTMEFRCNPGYTLVGKSKSRCQRNGLWSEMPPKCKPACQVHKCPKGKTCQLHPLLRTASCVCKNQMSCLRQKRQVCADDGRTYYNACIMEIAGCKRRKNLRKLYNGECREQPRCVTDHLRDAACKLPTNSIYRYNKETGTCGLVKSCFSTMKDGFKTKTECERTCYRACELKRDPGPCRNGRKVLRWMFSPDIDNCRRFIYSGCQGNANNFASHKECRTFCSLNEI